MNPRPAWSKLSAFQSSTQVAWAQLPFQWLRRRPRTRPKANGVTCAM